MRVVTLIILLAIGGGIAFCFIHTPTREWIFNQFEEAAHRADGFPLAKTPKEAVDLYVRAINERKYKSAARYVTKDYAELLRKADSAGQAVGKQLQRIYNLMEDKGYRTAKVHVVLIEMDPFPADFKIKPDSIKETKTKELAEVVFEQDPKAIPKKGAELTDSEIKQFDPKMWKKFPLMPKEFTHEKKGGIFVPRKQEIKFEKECECWKIDFKPQTSECDYFLEHYKRYVEGYKKFADEMIQERKLIDDAERELFEIIRRQNIK